jgi:hypothetical protein
MWEFVWWDSSRASSHVVRPRVAGWNVGGGCGAGWRGPHLLRVRPCHVRLFAGSLAPRRWMDRSWRVRIGGREKIRLSCNVGQASAVVSDGVVLLSQNPVWFEQSPPGCPATEETEIDVSSRNAGAR